MTPVTGAPDQALRLVPIAFDAPELFDSRGLRLHAVTPVPLRPLRLMVTPYVAVQALYASDQQLMLSLLSVWPRFGTTYEVHNFHAPARAFPPGTRFKLEVLVIRKPRRTFWQWLRRKPLRPFAQAMLVGEETP